MSLRMRVYLVSADGERRTVTEEFEYEGDQLPLVSMEMPRCRCPRCVPRSARQSAEQAAAS